MSRPARFFIITLGLMFGIGIPVVLSARGALPLDLPVGILAVGVFSPGLTAAFLAYREAGWRGIRGLLSPFLRWRLPIALYLVALLLPFGVNGISHGVIGVVGGALPRVPGALPQELQTVWFVAPLMFLIPSATEEMGWRGYALPYLLERHTAVRASVLIGLIWAVWHLPLALVPGSPQAALPFGWYIVNVVAFSVIFTWLHNLTERSLIAVTLLHASIQVSNVVIPLATSGGGSYQVSVVLYALVALAFVLIYGSSLAKHFDRDALTVERTGP